MRWTSVRRWFDRVEIRLAATLLVLAAPVLAAALFLSLAYAAHEMLEERGEFVTALAEAAARDLASAEPPRLEGPLYALLEREHVSLRIVEGERSIAELGPAARFASRARDAQTMRDAIRAGAEDVFYVARDIGGRRLEVAGSLDDFIGERAELITGFLISLVVGLLGSAIFAVAATQRALVPLHRATEAIGAVNASQLQTRLPLRHTGDAVDRHAEALNQALDRLENGFARMLAFSSDAAHELRTPINRLLNQSGAALLAGRGARDPEQTLLDVQATAEQMQEIVEGLLLLAQADDGRLRTRMAPLRLGVLLDGLQELYGPACEEHGVRLETKTEDLMISADEGLLIRALGNLVDNALEHTPGDGRITIHSTTCDGGAAISVCDTGCGVPEADLERIFDRFVRLDTGRRRGSGLGLTIARAIVNAHGGTLRARRAHGGGTCFDLWLPGTGPGLRSKLAGSS